MDAEAQVSRKAGLTEGEADDDGLDKLLRKAVTVSQANLPIATIDKDIDDIASSYSEENRRPNALDEDFVRLLERTRQRRELLDQKMGKHPEAAPRKRRSPLSEDLTNIVGRGTSPSDGSPKRQCVRGKEQEVKPDTPAIASVRSRLHNLATQRTEWTEEEAGEMETQPMPSPRKSVCSPPTQQAKTAEVAQQENAQPSSQRKSRFAQLANNINNWEDDLSHPTIVKEEEKKPRWQPPKAKTTNASEPTVVSSSKAASLPSAAASTTDNRPSPKKTPAASGTKNTSTKSPVKSSGRVDRAPSPKQQSKETVAKSPAAKKPKSSKAGEAQEGSSVNQAADIQKGSSSAEGEAPKGAQELAAESTVNKEGKTQRESSTSKAEGHVAMRAPETPRAAVLPTSERPLSTRLANWEQKISESKVDVPVTPKSGMATPAKVTQTPKNAFTPAQPLSTPAPEDADTVQLRPKVRKLAADEPTAHSVSARMSAWEQMSSAQGVSSVKKVQPGDCTPIKTPGPKTPAAKKSPAKTSTSATPGKSASQDVVKERAARLDLGSTTGGQDGSTPGQSHGRSLSPKKAGSAMKLAQQQQTKSMDMAERLRQERMAELQTIQNRWKNGILRDDKEGQPEEPPKADSSVKTDGRQGVREKARADEEEKMDLSGTEDQAVNGNAITGNSYQNPLVTDKTDRPADKQTVEASSVTPDTTTQTGEASSVTPDTISKQTGKASSVTPDTSTQTGEASSVTPDTSTQTGEASSVTPDTISNQQALVTENIPSEANDERVAVQKETIEPVLNIPRQAEQEDKIQTEVDTRENVPSVNDQGSKNDNDHVKNEHSGTVHEQTSISNQRGNGNEKTGMTVQQLGSTKLVDRESGQMTTADDQTALADSNIVKGAGTFHDHDHTTGVTTSQAGRGHDQVSPAGLTEMADNPVEPLVNTGMATNQTAMITKQEDEIEMQDVKNQTDMATEQDHSQDPAGLSNNQTGTSNSGIECVGSVGDQAGTVGMHHESEIQVDLQQEKPVVSNFQKKLATVGLDEASDDKTKGSHNTMTGSEPSSSSDASSAAPPRSSVPSTSESGSKPARPTTLFTIVSQQKAEASADSPKPVPAPGPSKVCRKVKFDDSFGSDAAASPPKKQAPQMDAETKPAPESNRTVVSVDGEDCEVILRRPRPGSQPPRAKPDEDEDLSLSAFVPESVRRESILPSPGVKGGQDLDSSINSIDSFEGAPGAPPDFHKSTVDLVKLGQQYADSDSCSSLASEVTADSSAQLPASARGPSEEMEESVDDRDAIGDLLDEAMDSDSEEASTSAKPPAPVMRRKANQRKATVAGNLPFSINEYRASRNMQIQEVKQTIVRNSQYAGMQVKEEDVQMPTSVPTPAPRRSVQDKIKELQELVQQEQSVIMQTSNALNQCCSSSSSFAGSTEQVECNRILLISCQKRQAYMMEIQKLKDTKTVDQNGPGPKGSLTVSDIRLPLKKEFVTKIGTSRDTMTYYFILLLRNGPQVICTQMLSTHDAMMRESLDFPNLIKINNISGNFQLQMDIYSLSVSREATGKDKKRKTPRKIKGGSALTVQSPGGPMAVHTSSFTQVTTVHLTMKSLDKHCFTLDRLSHLSPLHGMIYMKLKCVMEANVEERGFLTMFEDVSGFGSWHRRWCALSGNKLQFWKYPDDETRKDPMGYIDLKRCTTEKVGLISRDICARPHTFELASMRQPRQGEKDTLVSTTYNTMTTVRHMLSADTKEERIMWCNKINRALATIRTWHPEAMRPIPK